MFLGDDGNDFSWGSFFTNIGTSAAQGAAQAGVQRLTQAIAPKPAAVVTLAPGSAASTAALGAIPIYVWALGGLGLVLVLIMAMGRR